MVDAASARRSRHDGPYCRECNAYDTDPHVVNPCPFADAKPGIENAQDLFPGDRSDYPVFSGLLMYFPHACAYVAKVSKIANEQHNPGEPMHWAKEKSIGGGDQIVRHAMEAGTRDKDGTRHSGKAAWRAMEKLEREILADIAAGRNWE